jgi:hypothetical protein
MEIMVATAGAVALGGAKTAAATGAWSESDAEFLWNLIKGVSWQLGEVRYKSYGIVDNLRILHAAHLYYDRQIENALYELRFQLPELFSARKAALRYLKQQWEGLSRGPRRNYKEIFGRLRVNAQLRPEVLDLFRTLPPSMRAEVDRFLLPATRGELSCMVRPPNCLSRAGPRQVARLLQKYMSRLKELPVPKSPVMLPPAAEQAKTSRNAPDQPGRPQRNSKQLMRNAVDLIRQHRRAIVGFLFAAAMLSWLCDWVRWIAKKLLGNRWPCSSIGSGRISSNLGVSSSPAASPAKDRASSPAAAAADRAYGTNRMKRRNFLGLWGLGLLGATGAPTTFHTTQRPTASVGQAES